VIISNQHQCNQLLGKTRLRNDLLRVEWNVKLLLTNQPNSAWPFLYG